MPKVVLAETYADLEATDLSSSEADAVAGALRDSHETVVAVEPWLADEKDLLGYGRHDRLFAGRVEGESEKAWLLEQPGTDTQAWLPKSVTTLFEAIDNADLRTPQQTLGGEFA